MISNTRWDSRKISDEDTGRLRWIVLLLATLPAYEPPMPLI